MARCRFRLRAALMLPLRGEDGAFVFAFLDLLNDDMGVLRPFAQHSHQGIGEFGNRLRFLFARGALENLEIDVRHMQ